MCVSVNVHTCTIVHVGEFNTPTVTSAATQEILPPLQDVRTLYNCLKLQSVELPVKHLFKYFISLF